VKRVEESAIAIKAGDACILFLGQLELVNVQVLAQSLNLAGLWDNNMTTRVNVPV